jgi:hypothetical protein
MSHKLHAGWPFSLVEAYDRIVEQSPLRGKFFRAWECLTTVRTTPWQPKRDTARTLFLALEHFTSGHLGCRRLTFGVQRNYYETRIS